MLKPDQQVLRELVHLRDGHVKAWLEECMKDVTKRLVWAGEEGTQVLQGEARALQSILEYVDASADILEKMLR